MPNENAVELEDIWIEGYGENATYDWEITRTMGLTHIDFSNNNLNGTIPTTIGELVNLEAIDMSWNPELGADGCCDGADSYYLSFYGYNTTLPTEIGKLRKLQVMQMDSSRFMRHLPTEIGNLRNLKYWRFSGSYETNQISGSIPSEFGRLTRALEFFMQNNSLSGTIPNEITNMESLETFLVQDNKLSGSLPDDIGNLEKLQHWDTFGNKLMGDMPSSIQNIGSLDYLYIQNEHTDAIRNYYCRQRIAASANGRKYNWQVLANEYKNYKDMSVCANPFDLSEAFDSLSGDV